MSRFNAVVSKFVRNEEGAALVEYALLLALVAVVSVLVLTSVGDNVSAKFSSVSASF